MQKVANRITVGLVLAAGGVGLLFTILMNDIKARRKLRTRSSP